MKIKLSPSQYKLLARYAEDISKSAVAYNVIGYFLPSILPTAVKPTSSQFLLGAIFALTTLLTAVILEGKAGGKK